MSNKNDAIKNLENIAKVFDKINTSNYDFTNLKPVEPPKSYAVPLDYSNELVEEIQKTQEDTKREIWEEKERKYQEEKEHRALLERVAKQQIKLLKQQLDEQKNNYNKLDELYKFKTKESEKYEEEAKQSKKYNTKMLVIALISGGIALASLIATIFIAIFK